MMVEVRNNKLLQGFHVVVSCALTFVLVYVLSQLINLQELVTRFKRIDLVYLAVFCSLSILGLLFRAIRYLECLRAVEPKISLLTHQAIVITAVRNAFVDFLPARLGEGIYIYLLTRFGVRLRLGVVSFALCLAFDLIVLLLIISAMLFVSPAIAFLSGPSDVLLQWLGALGCAVSLATLFFFRPIAFWLSKLLQIIAKKLSPLRSFCEQCIEYLDQLQQYPQVNKLILLTVGLRVAKYASLLMVLGAVLAAWDVSLLELQLPSAVIAFVAAEASASLPISGVMGFGAYEGVWAYLMADACGAACSALNGVVIAFMVHVITQVFGYSIGFLGLSFVLIREIHRKN